MSDDRYDELREDVERYEEPEHERRDAQRVPREAPEGTAEQVARGGAEDEFGGRGLGARDWDEVADEHEGTDDNAQRPSPTAHAVALGLPGRGERACTGSVDERRVPGCLERGEVGVTVRARGGYRVIGIARREVVEALLRRVLANPLVRVDAAKRVAQR